MARDCACLLEQFPQERQVVVRVNVATEQTEETQQFVAIDAAWTVMRECEEEF